MNRSTIDHFAADRQDALSVLQRALAGHYTPRRLLILLAVQAALLTFHVTDSWHASPDSALYMGLGRSMAAGEGYVFNHEPHAMVPPMFPALLAGVERLVGSSYLTFNILQCLLALACTPAAFWLMRRLVGRDLALPAAGMLALNLVFWKASSRVLSDTLFTLVALVAMALAAEAAAGGRRRWPLAILAAAAIGAAALVRTNGAILAPVAAVALCLNWRGRRWLERMAAAVSVVIVAFVPTVAWTQSVAATGTDGETYYQASHLVKPLGELIRGVAGNLFNEVVTEASNLIIGFSDVPPVANLLIPGLMLIGCVVALRRREAIMPLTLLGTVAILTIVPGVRPRYFVFLLPAMTVLLLTGGVQVARWIARSRSLDMARTRYAVLAVVGMLLAANVAHSVAKGVGYRRDETPGESRVARYQGWFVGCDYIGRHGSPAAVVLTRQGSIVHYLSGARTLGTEGRRPFTEGELAEAIRQAQPTWLLAENDETSTQLALDAINTLGATAEQVDDAGLTDDIQLWRIRYP